MEEKENQKKSENALREETILEFWKKEDVFTKSLNKASPKGEFVFFEGPPTANGKPGIHHVETRSFKDVIPRYKTMRGFHVSRKGGWDTHGLPVEIQVEKELGFKSKKEIESYGIAEFNKKCKESVLKYIDLWKEFSERIGYWSDYENAYFTFQNNYIESVWNIVKKVDDQNLLYKDYKVLPWCPRCGTALSSHELAQGYVDVKDLSVYVKFKVKNPEKINLSGDIFILAWTTTPWTLPGNVALAVGKDIEYVRLKTKSLKIKDESQNLKVDIESTYIVAKDLAEKIFENFEYEVMEEIKGSDLVGLEYEPLFPYLKDNLPEEEKNKLPNAFKVYDADFVTTTDGTGVVHTAVMYGQDDFVLGTQYHLPKFHLVKEDGTFKDFCGAFSRRFVKEVNEAGKPTLAVDMIDDLKKRDLFFSQENYKHSYPHCWRCKTPLIYFARDSWYIKMSSLRDTLVSENKKINWEPDYIKDGRFGEWLREVKDWAVSRERYWGTPIPVWVSEDGEEKLVVDSIETLKKHTEKSGNKYFLMRHGEAEHNVKKVLTSDVEAAHHLTEKGRVVARETAEKLKKENIDLIFYSPLQRTKETFEEVKKFLGEIESIEENRLREEGFGGVSGTEISRFTEFFPNFETRLHTSVLGCETLLEVKKRIGDFLYEIEEKYKNKNILIITHDGPAAIFKVVGFGAVTDEEFEKVYEPGKDFIRVGEYVEFDFTPLPHDEEFRLDLHKPYIDFVTLVSNGKKLKRVKEILDVWFDSGSMPFAQHHFPFENKNLIEEGKQFPADYICEAIDQTRGWFYTLHAISALLQKGVAYKNVICLGHLLDKDGKKMSKSLGNVIDPWEMADKYGVDVIRLWMYSVNQPGESKNFDEKTVDELRKKFFNLLDNVLSFYLLSRDESLEGVSYLKSQNILDVWILAQLSNLNKEVIESLDNFKILEPVRAMKDFIDDLSTWYVRRSRERIREGDKEVLSTLYFVLKNFAKILAPFAPFYAEHLFLILRNESESESVHLENFPELNLFDENLIKEMKNVRALASLGLEARNRANIKVRQPLAVLKVSSAKFHTLGDDRLVEIIKEEVNVKEIVFDEGVEGVELDTLITEELKKEGTVREFIRSIQELRKEEGLNQKDKVKLSVSCGENLKKIINEEGFLKEIKKVTGLLTLTFEEVSGKEITVDGEVVRISIEKV